MDDDDDRLGRTDTMIKTMKMRRVPERESGEMEDEELRTEVT